MATGGLLIHRRTRARSQATSIRLAPPRPASTGAPAPHWRHRNSSGQRSPSAQASTLSTAQLRLHGHATGGLDRQVAGHAIRWGTGQPDARATSHRGGIEIHQASDHLGLDVLGMTAEKLHRRLLKQPQLLPSGSSLLLAVSGGHALHGPAGVAAGSGGLAWLEPEPVARRSLLLARRNSLLAFAAGTEQLVPAAAAHGDPPCTTTPAESPRN